MTRRVFIGAIAIAAVPVRSFRLRAIAAVHMPHTRTILSADPRVAEHFANGGVFEIREYPTGSRLQLFDSLEERYRTRIFGESPTAISLYRPA